MKKLLATAAALALLLALALGVGSLAWRPAARSGPPRLEELAVGAGALRAGAAAVTLDPLPGSPIAGFPRLRWTNAGLREPVYARALVLSEPGVDVALVSAEILLVPAPLARAVEQRVADLGLARVVLAATHTHAGPGGWWDDPVAERVALGPYDRARLDHLADRIALAVRQAWHARAPATLAIGRTRVAGLARNRTGGPVDARLVSARLADAAGRELARVVVFPAHPTLLGSRNDRLSGDWPGALAAGARSPLLFFQGASGDQSARPPPGHDRDPAAYGRRVAAALGQLAHGPADGAPALGVAVARVVLPPPDLGASPPALRRITRNLLYDLFPARTEVAALRLGPLVLLAVPAEPVAQIGARWRDRVGADAEILSLSNDYVGYVETPERMAHGEGETPRTYFGPDLERRLEEAVVLAAAELRRAFAAAAPAGGGAAADQNRTAGAPASQER